MTSTSAGHPFLTLEPESPQPRDWDPITMMREFDKGAYVRSPQGPPTLSPTSERRFKVRMSRRNCQNTLPSPVQFTSEPRSGLIKSTTLPPKEFHSRLQQIENVSEEQQIDFPPQELTFFQRFRQCLITSSYPNTSPYIAIPIIAMATLSFGLE